MSILVSTANDFQRMHNGISNNLKKIENNTTDLEALVQKIGTSEDSEELRDRYLRLQNETKGLMQQMNNDLQDLQRCLTGSDSDQRKRKTAVEGLTKQYMAILERFQTIQKTGIKKEKDSLERTKSVAYHPNNGSDSHYGGGATTGPYQQQIVLPMEQEADLNALRERDEQIRQLESNIVQVRELFDDISKLVAEQGGIIISIANDIENSGDNVHRADECLDDALDSKKAARKKKIIIAVIIFIILAILALILGIYFGTSR